MLGVLPPTQFFAIALLAFLAFAARPSAAEQQLSYEPELVLLTGTIVIEEFYGPPNYGENPETDSVEKALILTLDEPVTVLTNPNDQFNDTTFNGVSRVQIAAPIEFQLGRRAGHRVTLEGMLYQAFNAHHHTDVLIYAESIVEDAE